SLAAEALREHLIDARTLLVVRPVLGALFAAGLPTIAERGLRSVGMSVLEPAEPVHRDHAVAIGRERLEHRGQREVALAPRAHVARRGLTLLRHERDEAQRRRSIGARAAR